MHVQCVCVLNGTVSVLRSVAVRRAACTELFIKCSDEEKIGSKMFSLHLSSRCPGSVSRDEVYFFCRGS